MNSIIKGLIDLLAPQLAKLFDSFKATSPIVAAVLVSVLIGIQAFADGCTFDFCDAPWFDLIKYALMVLLGLVGSRTSRYINNGVVKKKSGEVIFPPKDGEVTVPPFIAEPVDLVSLAEYVPYWEKLIGWEDKRNNGEGAIVCVTDTGGKFTHPDMNWEGNQFGQDFTGTGLEDRGGHSHAVAGLIGAREDNNAGIRGIASKALVVPYKCMEVNSGQWQWFANAVRQFADATFPGYENRIKILNASLGGSAAPSYVLDAIKYATNKGVIIVASAGNPGNDQPVGYPGAYEDWVIAVGAIDGNLNPATFTAKGPEVDIANFGVRIYTHNHQQGYWNVSGTSFSSPITAAQVAVLVTEYKDYFLKLQGKARRDAVEQLLEARATDVWTPGKDLLTGEGYPEFKNLLAPVDQDPPNDPPTGLKAPVQTAPPDNYGTTSTTVEMEWTLVEGATEYLVHVSESRFFTKLEVEAKSSVGKLVVEGFEKGKTYYWRVKALNEKEESEFSGTSSFSIKAEVPPPPDDEYPLREFNIKLDEGYSILYSKINPNQYKFATYGNAALADVKSNVDMNVLQIEELVVRTKTTKKFDDEYADVSTAVKNFFRNRGLFLKYPDAKGAHDATILFLNLILRKELPTFDVVSMSSKDKGRKQV